MTDDAMVRVLIVDDEAGLRRSLARILAARGFSVEMAEDGDRAIELLEQNEPEVILCDLMMPKMGGFEVLEHTKRTHPRVEVVMMTAHADVDSAVAAVKSGAYDFLTKPFASNDAVALAVSKAADHKRLVERAARLEERLVAHERFGELVGTSGKMQAVYRLIEGVASATSTVLILGESGTGKELVARAIHQHSARADRPFVPVNCAAIPKELVESELFGHVRGAFTGAQSARTGLFEAGNSGTLFLDEVGDLPLAAQVKLLRALQDGEIKRVGSDETRFVDVRVLAATNVDLQQRIADGTFRRDLYYRLNVIPIHVPPLRERDDDIVLLTHHVLQKLARRMGRAPKRVSAEAMEALRAYAWPGNVRELEHAVEHAFVLATGERIELGDLPQMAQQAPSSSRDGRDTDVAEVPRAGLPGLAALAGSMEPQAPHVRFDLFALPYAEAKRRAMKAFDDGYVREVLSRSGGNLSAAARHAGLDRSNFRRIVKRRKTAE
ncbi:sigma-54 dependent transcriptional regulator [Pendulispora rubella]|uniref:Sigma-54 dependent transcriptional regulator n=1 Tax=Pendulispora rubella TaxID=2741070 RepID=A0ABZ2LD37_9BACT